MKLNVRLALTGALLVAAVAATFTAPANAAKVKITGSEAAVFDQATGSFTFKGPVTMTDDNTTIEGENVTYNGQTEVLQFAGPVKMTQNNSVLQGRDLVYNARTGEGTLNQALGSVTPAGATSPVYISGEKVSTCQQVTTLEGARLTTCDPESPGFYLASRTIEIYPGDKLILYGVRFVESGMTLFYWPRLTFSLKRTDPNQASEFSLPRIGYSATEGWFIKTSYGYRGPGQQRGHILLDYMQLLGWGAGVDHTLYADKNGSDKIYLYAQPNRNTGHTDTAFSFDTEHTFPGNLTVKGHSAYTTEFTSAEQLRFDNQLSVSRDYSSGSVSFSYNDIRLHGPVEGYETTGNTNVVQNLGDGWRLRLNGSLNRRDRSDMPATAYRNLLGYLAEVGKTTNDWSVNIAAEDRFNPDLAKETPPEVAWRQAQQLPEVTASINNLSLGGWKTPFALDAAWGRLLENRYGSSGRFYTERTHIAAKIKPFQFDLGPLGKLSWSGSAKRRVYGTGESQWVAAAQSDYSLSISDKLSLSGDYLYEQAFGDESPFYFDRVTDQEKVQGRLEYRTNPVQWTLSGGWDLFNAAPLDVVGSVRLQPIEAIKLQAQGAYSLVDNDWLYVIGTAQYTPNDYFTVNLGAKYNMQMQRTDRVDALLQWDLGGWQLGYTGIYDGVQDKFDVGDFTITRDLNCRAIDLRYNQSRREVWLEYRITAFPAASVKLGATEQHLMFDASGWEEVLATE